MNEGRKGGSKEGRKRKGRIAPEEKRQDGKEVGKEGREGGEGRKEEERNKEKKEKKEGRGEVREEGRKESFIIICHCGIQRILIAEGMKEGREEGKKEGWKKGSFHYLLSL